MFAVVTPKKNCTKTLFYGTDYHSHMGKEFGGMAVLGHEIVRRIHRITRSQFKTEFLPDLHLFSGSMGIGVISPKDEQPLLINPVNAAIGWFAIATVGYIDNATDLADELMASTIGFEYEDGDKTINMTKLTGMLISQSDTLISGIQKMFYRIRGSISLLVINTEGIIAARSLFGHSPLFLAQNGDAWAITMETTALHNLGFKLVKPLLPGEIMVLTEQGPMVKSQEYTNRSQICAFLPVYTAFPSAEYGQITAENYREQAGAYHALRDIKEEIQVEMVAGMADSGTAYAVGYAKATLDYVINAINQKALSGQPLLFDEITALLSKVVPYRRSLVKYTPSRDRSYTKTLQADRDEEAKMKQILVKDIWDESRSLVLTEDSIVRNTQLTQCLQQQRHIIEILWGKTWPDIHLRIGCPPLSWPCRYMFSTRAMEELAARRAVTRLLDHPPTDEEMRPFIDPLTDQYQAMVESIAQELGVKSLRYLPLEEMIRIIGLKPDEVCTYCWNGKGV